MLAKSASRVGKGLSRRERTCLWHVLDAKNRTFWGRFSVLAKPIFPCRQSVVLPEKSAGARFRQKKAPHF